MSRSTGKIAVVVGLVVGWGWIGLAVEDVDGGGVWMVAIGR